MGNDFERNTPSPVMRLKARAPKLDTGTIRLIRTPVTKSLGGPPHILRVALGFLVLLSFARFDARSQDIDKRPGSEDYATLCSPCHGVRGDGNGPLATMLEPKPTRHSDARAMGELSDAYLYDLLRNGGPSVGKSPLMAPWGQYLSEQQIKDLVGYVRALSVH